MNVLAIGVQETPQTLEATATSTGRSQECKHKTLLLKSHAADTGLGAVELELT